MRPIVEPARSWWSYGGPLCVVFSGLAGGTLVLPVRLPASPSNQPILDHHLADPSRWQDVPSESTVLSARDGSFVVDKEPRRIDKI